ncbi:SDR family oxidoreductase [Parabacteroides sp. AF17-28]|uniref:3-ketodihydrosphingosine reductase n=1 Tax=Parabacteroides sp. AF17-28 TaxID=2292241 RepID=UPI000EFF1F48|nr:SDR family oxidoreductase [Parabacteroides sp. AF17-28]RHR61803.1 SDR family NAD(P)-dependent oxidoreductase [Parabacteroides sp. AF17-28]
MTDKQIILVTGASSGFGKITASLLAQQGHIVYGTSRKETTGTPEGVRMIKMDVIDTASIHEAIARIISEQGRIDVVVNNAGVGISGAIELATDEEIAWQMNTNFTGVTRVCSAVLPYMRKAGKGKIINISSIGGVIAVPFQGFYSASKFAVEGYSEALAVEVHPFGIQVCLVEPGDFNTNFTANRNISSATQEHPDYKETFARSTGIIEDAENNGSHPEKLGHVICKLVKAKRPAFRTKVGPFDQVLFARVKGFLPDKLVHAVIRFFYKIK